MKKISIIFLLVCILLFSTIFTGCDGGGSEYFRMRLDLPNGFFITKEHLEQYGTDVDFYKIDNETYYMDYSVK